MARFAIIKNGTVENIAEADEVFAQTQGWIAVPAGVSIGWLFAGGVFSAPIADPATVQKQAENAVQQLLDTTAQSHGYDNIISLCSYATSKNVTWQKEGQYGVDFRDACWGKAEEIQNAVLAGTRPLPTVGEVLAAMPAVVWPV